MFATYYNLLNVFHLQEFGFTFFDLFRNKGRRNTLIKAPDNAINSGNVYSAGYNNSFIGGG